MQVTKEMHDKELQSRYRVGRFVARLVNHNMGIRFMQNTGFNPMQGNEIAGVHNDERYIESQSTPGHQIRVRVFRPFGYDDEKLPAMLYTHGGGYAVGSPEQPLAFYKDLMKTRKLVVVAPAYRLSIDHPFPAGFNDCYDTLMWMRDNADALGIMPDKYMIAGHSAGGGMTAAVTLKARDTKDVNIAFHMPIYPMIDHRMITESSKSTFGAMMWDSNSNKHGWELYLKGIGGGEVPAYASPALNQDFTNFPPAISYVGDLEPFKDETINYMEALNAAGIPTKFRLYKGAYHGFENDMPKAQISKDANQFQLESFAEYYDRYVMN